MSATGALARLTGPLRRALDGLDRRAHLAGRARANVSEDQLRDLVEEVTDAAGDQLIEPEDLEMMHSVVELGQTVVREVMVPRTAMVTIAASADLAQAMALFLQSGHSRVPVRGQDADDIVGVAYLKDAALAVWRDEAARGRTAAAVARPAFFVPESKPVDDLLRELQARRVQMAIVVDEWGGVAGLVTVEDILEEIVGELTDEHDPEPEGPEALGGGRFRVPAALALDELEDLFGREIEDPDVDSVGGLLAKALGRVPIPGSRAEAQGLELVAETAAGRRKQVATLVVRDLGTSGVADVGGGDEKREDGK